MIIILIVISGLHVRDVRAQPGLQRPEFVRLYYYFLITIMSMIMIVINTIHIYIYICIHIRTNISLSLYIYTHTCQTTYYTLILTTNDKNAHIWLVEFPLLACFMEFPLLPWLVESSVSQHELFKCWPEISRARSPLIVNE